MSTAMRKGAADSYLERIKEFPLRRLRTAADHVRAKAIVLRLSSDEADRGTAEYLDVLIDLIADYEKRAGAALDASAVSAAELVRHRLAERGMSISALAHETGVPQSNLSEMLAGKRDWSKRAIRSLSRHLNIRADRFFV